MKMPVTSKLIQALAEQGVPLQIAHPIINNVFALEKRTIIAPRAFEILAWVAVAYLMGLASARVF